MKKYNVEIPDCVIGEIEEYVYFIAQDSVENAFRWYEKIEAGINKLDSLPERCTVAEESQYFDFEVRQLIIGNYRVLFRIKSNAVQVLHFRQDSMLRGFWSSG
jgi:plasmid stabilization system protein ParE